jgi:hypothetical protein
MRVTPEKVVSRNRQKETVMAFWWHHPEPSKTRLKEAGDRCALDSPQGTKDLIPYSIKELRYLCAMWDEAERLHQPGRRHRKIFAGAVGVVLAGWLIYGLGLSCSTPLGGSLMLGGVLMGAWHWLKFRRRQGHSTLEG